MKSQQYLGENDWLIHIIKLSMLIRTYLLLMQISYAQERAEGLELNKIPNGITDKPGQKKSTFSSWALHFARNRDFLLLLWGDIIQNLGMLSLVLEFLFPILKEPFFLKWKHLEVCKFWGHTVLLVSWKSRFEGSISVRCFWDSVRSLTLKPS